uniref:Calmodulin n=1 Tax=Helicotheca tamesis TaxID=374047 RepID=A0A7S2GZG6_9STRA|mmetsp:Transcript_1367/g.1955  ORF Transcript_1367/g.1955 Transcript_1367/m.1955 type:complete len:552 (+) Transcript_1367:76-1731(+)
MGCGPSNEAASYVTTNFTIKASAGKDQLGQQNSHRTINTTHTQSDDTSCSSPINCSKNIAISGIVNDEKNYLGRRGIRYEGPNGKRIEDVYDGVHENTRNICRSVAGFVRRVTHKQTRIDCAVKIFNLERLTEKGMQQLKEEVRILSEVDHPNIVRLEEVYRSESAVYLVQELCEGGDLFHWIGNRAECKKEGLPSEERCADIMRQLLSGMRYLHSKGIVHRDMKLENILFDTEGANSELKIIDFGLSKHFIPGERQHENVGTLYTAAPEVLRKNYDERCDVWSIGVIAYVLLSGEAPFGGCYGEKDRRPIITNITSGIYHFEPEDTWANRSQEAKEFIRRLLVTDPNDRPTAAEAQKLPWLLRSRRQSQSLSPAVVRSLISFKNFQNDLRKLLCEVLSYTLLPCQVKSLRREFSKLDKDATGEISLQDLKCALLSQENADIVVTEKDVEDIFDAIRIHKTDSCVHWHEFIAAVLCLCSVDERNQRLAFDRFDCDHKGYIAFNDVLHLVGDEETDDATIQQMWTNSLKSCGSRHLHMNYNDFQSLMRTVTR